MQPAQRSLSLGLQTLLLRALGTVPGPIVYGAIIDQSCILWQGTEWEGDVSCRVYDNTATSRHFVAIQVGWRVAATWFMALALYCSIRLDRRVQEAVAKK